MNDTTNSSPSLAITPEELRLRREALGISQYELAGLLEPAVRQATVSRWEAGTSPIPTHVRVEVRGLELQAEGLVKMLLDEVEDGPVLRVELLGDPWESMRMRCAVRAAWAWESENGHPLTITWA